MVQEANASGKPEDMLTWTLLYGREKVSQMKERKAPPEPKGQTSETWNTVPWKKLEQHCFRIQKRMCAMRRIEISLV